MTSSDVWRDLATEELKVRSPDDLASTVNGLDRRLLCTAADASPEPALPGTLAVTEGQSVKAFAANLGSSAASFGGMRRELWRHPSSASPRSFDRAAASRPCGVPA